MPVLPVYNLKKEKVGTVELNDSVYAGEVKQHLLNTAVRYQIARRYEMKTSNSLTRSEVHGTTKKTYRQKGTGQARHGAVTAPIFVGGGKAHGPRFHRRTYKLNKKVRQAALVCALSFQQKEDRLFIIDKLEMEKQSTKAVAESLKKLGLESAVFVNAADEQSECNFNQSIRNLPKTKFLPPEGVNVFDILKFKNVILSKKAAQKLTERLSHV